MRGKVEYARLSLHKKNEHNKLWLLTWRNGCKDFQVFLHAHERSPKEAIQEGCDILGIASCDLNFRPNEASSLGVPPAALFEAGLSCQPGEYVALSTAKALHAKVAEVREELTKSQSAYRQTCRDLSDSDVNLRARQDEVEQWMDGCSELKQRLKNMKQRLSVNLDELRLSVANEKERTNELEESRNETVKARAWAQSAKDSCEGLKLANNHLRRESNSLRDQLRGARNANDHIVRKGEYVRDERDALAKENARLRVLLADGVGQAARAEIDH